MKNKTLLMISSVLVLVLIAGAITYAQGVNEQYKTWTYSDSYNLNPRVQGHLLGMCVIGGQVKPSFAGMYNNQTNIYVYTGTVTFMNTGCQTSTGLRKIDLTGNNTNAEKKDSVLQDMKSYFLEVYKREITIESLQGTEITVGVNNG